MGMFDPDDQPDWYATVLKLESEKDRLRKLVYDACKLAYNHGGREVEPEIKRILYEAGFLSGLSK